MVPVHSKFNLQKNGLLFINSFTLPFDTKITLPIVGEIDLGKVVYGLCGGMCFAALDYFYAGQPVPAFKQPQDIPADYLIYLWDRQIDSMGVVVVPKVIEWMLHEDKDVGSSTARYEVPKMRRQLDQGKPVVLGLVRGKGISDPTVNHQVLAIGYDFDEALRQIEIYLYDPNHPGSESNLTMNLANPSQGLQATQDTGETTRGLFVITYQPQHPPQEK